MMRQMMDVMGCEAAYRWGGPLIFSCACVWCGAIDSKGFAWATVLFWLTAVDLTLWTLIRLAHPSMCEQSIHSSESPRHHTHT
mmetsp:Transcript_16646/g.47402  ORF Transcript_16646/g.47402 Transcript_16646/m.47402 type:complete len:83 (+) Transcript_16646:899-1147(+)